MGTFRLYAGILGIATGSASLASGLPRKAAAIIGCVAGELVGGIELALALLSLGLRKGGSAAAACAHAHHQNGGTDPGDEHPHHAAQEQRHGGE
jgi:hypothetical protein